MTKIYLEKTKGALKILIIAMLLFAFKVSAQCPIGSVLLSTQAEVNAFATSYPNCTQISGNLSIGVNTGTSDITNLTALTNLTAVTGALSINNNHNITNFNGLNNITSVGSYLQVYGNISLTNLNLTSLVNLGAFVIIDSNSSLTNISLNSLTNIGQFLFINNNDALTNLNGLNNLANIVEDIDIEGNALLNDISAIQNTTFHPSSGLGLTIVNNPSLAVCNILKICAYLANPSSTYPRNISGNSTTCSNEAAVIASCSTLSVTDIDKTELKIYPNPVKSVLNFSEEISKIKIVDISGRTVKEINASAKSVDVAKLENGIYIITATTNTGNVITKKLIKE